MSVVLASVVPKPADPVPAALAAIARGEIVVVLDDESRENEGDLIMAAEAATTEKIGFFLRHTSGLICAPMSATRLEELKLPAMVADNREGHGTAFTVSVDLADGVTTGISARDRAQTLAALADPESRSTDFVRPGHVFPLCSRAGGVLERRGHTEAAVDLMGLAGMAPAAVLCEVVSADKTAMAGTRELRRLARRYGLPLLSVGELVAHRVRRAPLVEPVAEAALPTRHGRFVSQVWRSKLDGSEHVSLSCGELTGGEPPLVRVHSECLTGDVFGSERCDCGGQLDDALAMIHDVGRGMVIYLLGHEGRGIGLAEKLRAYTLQDAGLDTVEANLRLGHPADARDYGVAAQILAAVGATEVKLMTNNPAKVHGLSDYGIAIAARVPIRPRVTAANVTYLATKSRRMGHVLPGADASADRSSGEAR
jgi:3,4-dihydroxy 2-butanone 4-phosphate synthase/GTP cyclohydrolase II